MTYSFDRCPAGDGAQAGGRAGWLVPASREGGGSSARSLEVEGGGGAGGWSGGLKGKGRAERVGCGRGGRGKSGGRWGGDGQRGGSSDSGQKDSEDGKEKHRDERMRRVTSAAETEFGHLPDLACWAGRCGCKRTMTPRPCIC